MSYTGYSFFGGGDVLILCGGGGEYSQHILSSTDQVEMFTREKDLQNNI